MFQIGTPASQTGAAAQAIRLTASVVRTFAPRCALLGMWLFLFSPLVVQALQGENATRFDKSFLFSVATTLLWAGTLHFSSRRPFALHLILLPLYVTTGIDLFLMSTFGNRLSSGYVLLALTNDTSMGDFLATYKTPVVVILAVTAGIYITAMFAIRRLALKPLRKISAACLMLLLAGYSAMIARSLESGSTFEQAALEVAGYEASVPVGGIFQSGLALYMFNQEAKYRTVREQHHFGAKSIRDNSGEVYVMVIGESSRANNWSLLGYGRNTNPSLSSSPGIIGLPNMLSTAPSTNDAVPSMLSPWPITDQRGILSHRSVVSAFAEAGFTTHWLSTQRVDGWSGALPGLAAEAEHTRYFDQSFDGALLEPFKAILASAAKGEKILIVLHINGSHFVYARRYPENFAHFHSDHAAHRQQLIDEYDNSILYTDWLLGKFIGALDAAHRPAALLFASDHGENLMDDKAGLLGHGIGTAYDLHPAAFVWASDALRMSRPQIWSTARGNAGAKLSSANLPHSLLDLAGIQIPELNRSLSIFSPAFTTRDRWYIADNKLHREVNQVASK
jgi:glucan phosphoethanolaminetransferase (alkaline phosphatase superfamily)